MATSFFNLYVTRPPYTTQKQGNRRGLLDAQEQEEHRGQARAQKIQQVSPQARRFQRIKDVKQNRLRAVFCCLGHFRLGIRML